MKRNIPVFIRIAGLLTILVVLASGFSLTGFGIDKALAATPKAISIPKAWGPVKGVIQGAGQQLLILEDSGGVIRIVGSNSGKADITITRNQRSNEQEAQSGMSSAGRAGAYKFFKDGTFTMTGGKEEPRVSGKWTALDDGRIKADLEMFGATTTIFFVFVGEELEADAGEEKKGRLVRVK